ncbi:MAG TPA: ATP synthase subunit I [Coleofasciculaceae cyanobacterium]
MSNLLLLPLTGLVGLGLGYLYFGGLWLTVRGLPTAQNPVLLTLLSFLGRSGAVGMGLGLIAASTQNAAPLHLLACLVPFFWSRNRLIQRLQPRLARR